MAGFENRGGGSWRITISNGYDSLGHKRYIRRTIHVDPSKTLLAQKREAEKQAALIEADFRRHLLTEGSKVRFEDLAEEYLQVKDLSVTTKEHYKFLLNGRIYPYMGNWFIQDITSRDIQLFYLSLKETTALTSRSKTGTLSGTTQLHYHRCIHAILQYAVSMGIITINPAANVQPPKKDTPEAKYYNPEDCVKLLDVLDQYPLKWRLYFYLSIYTGCRPGELLALDWPDITDNNLFIHANAIRVKGHHGAVRQLKTKTEGSVRHIVLPDVIVALLHQYKLEQCEYKLRFGAHWPEPYAIFTSDLGYRWDVSSPTQKFQKILKHHNLKPGPLYQLRHTVASILIRNMSIREVSDRMGHSQPSTTLNIYSHIIRDAGRAATDSITTTLENARKAAK